MSTVQVSCRLLTAFSAAILVAGCTSESATSPEISESVSAEADHGHPHPHETEAGHSHGAAPHDGTLADWGGGEYHVEFTVDHDRQQATVYVLGDDAKTPAPVSADRLLLSITDPQLQTDLLPQPQEEDPEGTSSRFVGTHEGLGVVQEYAGMISAEVEGTPYSGSFQEVAHDHDH